MATSKKTNNGRIQNNLKSYRYRTSSNRRIRIRNFRSHEVSILNTKTFINQNFLQLISSS